LSSTTKVEEKRLTDPIKAESKVKKLLKKERGTICA